MHITSLYYKIKQTKTVVYFVRMDFSIFEKRDLQTKIQVAQIKNLRVNKDDDVILFRGFVGGSDGRQYTHFNEAMAKAKIHYAHQGITLKSEMYINDVVKNSKRWGPTELIDHILEADIHIVSTHLSEGNIAKTASWNIPNILSNLSRLKYQLGNVMGIRNNCPVLRQGKKEIYARMQDYCLPTMVVDLPTDHWIEEEIISEEVMEKITR